MFGSNTNVSGHTFFDKDSVLADTFLKQQPLSNQMQVALSQVPLKIATWCLVFTKVLNTICGNQIPFGTSQLQMHWVLLLVFQNLKDWERGGRVGNLSLSLRKETFQERAVCVSLSNKFCPVFALYSPCKVNTTKFYLLGFGFVISCDGWQWFALYPQYVCVGLYVSADFVTRD